MKVKPLSKIQYNVYIKPVYLDNDAQCKHQRLNDGSYVQETDNNKDEGQQLEV